MSSAAVGRLRSLGSGIISSQLLVLLLCLDNWLAGVEALRMTALKIPQHVVLNQTVRMECNFNLDRESLYSVKWYKDGHEFYRYVPKEQPDVHVFALAGVSVDKPSSSERAVVLSRVDGDSTGRYRCEVSAEAPAFNTVSDHADMTVVVLPERGPIITGGKPKYQAGDVVRVNCTSAPSKPPALLMWYVNEEPRLVVKHSRGYAIRVFISAINYETSETICLLLSVSHFVLLCHKEQELVTELIFLLYFEKLVPQEYKIISTSDKIIT
ncbi:PREDICTED: pregnancy-specific beta-1-glycoprotein 1-like [Ceratosolen solmsi marchali]|uniref:Pregnancy-specific beta-1-glycoprotein 1-like n=1 Tax=Ceratosolen solmsi marchali TaxID=326594 RepID=A0AAJ6YNI8_9HYME|nr:PREDICTED: pregnancy-specific beta-1-glycoprotein 1-like [Ceratosolen solmsi marchali]